MPADTPSPGFIWGDGETLRWRSQLFFYMSYRDWGISTVRLGTARFSPMQNGSLRDPNPGWQPAHQVVIPSLFSSLACTRNALVQSSVARVANVTSENP